MQLRVLGSAGWMPTTDRSTACYAVRQGGTLVLLDAGTGVARLVAYPQLMEGVKEIHVLLSHFHLDHTIGLTYLTAIEPDHRAIIWGPGQYYGTESSILIDGMTMPPYQPKPLSEHHEIRNLPSAGLSLEDFDIAFRAQPLHSAISVAMRVNRLLTYCTDTAYDEDNSSFAHGSRLLLHEAWPDESGERSGHTSPAEAGMIAAAAEVDQLFLCHVPPRADVIGMAVEARKHFLQSAVAKDDQEIEL